MARRNRNRAGKMFSTGTKLQGTTLTLKADGFNNNGALKIATGISSNSALFGALGQKYDSFRVTGVICKSNVDGAVCVSGKGTYLLDADAVKPVKIKIDGELISYQTIQQTSAWYDESAQMVSEGYNPKQLVSKGAENIAEVLITFYPKAA